MAIESSSPKPLKLNSADCSVGYIEPFALASSPVESPEWTLVWSDEFEVAGAPDPTKWDHENGFIRNHEKQIYTVRRPENARVEGGMLIIEARQEPFANPHFDPRSDDWRYAAPAARYTSAALTTAGKASWKYGRIEARAKLPQGGGIWPAIWTLGNAITLPKTDPAYMNWPHCGEIDVVEHVGSDPHHIHGTAHFAADGKHTSRGGKKQVHRPGDEFHTYAVEWSADGLDFFFDGAKYHSVDTSTCSDAGYNGFHQPHYLIINLALGGDWAGEIDDAVLPQQLVVDYIRVYQRSDRSGANLDPRHSAREPLFKIK